MMSERKRIILNTMATYGRSLVAIALGLISVRWVLKGLGQTDFGLYGVVGSIIVFITFLNATMSGAVSRFFAYAVGRTRLVGMECGHRELNEWFNMALCVHTILPLLLILVGYPLGIYAIQHWLVIPPERLDACIIVFRLSLISAFASMVSVPYTALFAAHQLIMELNVLHIAQTVITFIFAYSLLLVDVDKFVYYAAYMTGVSFCFTIGTMVWAYKRFKMCRINFRLWLDLARLKSFFAFTGAKFFGAVCVVLRTQGGSLLLNRFFTPRVNASYTISMQVSGHTASLSQALVGALQPVIANREGGADRQGMLRMAETTCRMASFLVLLVAIPLLVEIKYVLTMWLTNVPPYTIAFCACMIFLLILDKMSIGYMLAANAYGKKILFYEIVNGILLVLALPMTYMLFKYGLAPYYLVVSFCLTWALYSIARVLFCRWQLGVSFSRWAIRVAMPVFVVSCLSYCCGSGWQFFLSASFVRVALVVFTTTIIIAATGYFWILSQQERSLIIQSLRKIKGKLKR